MKKWKWFLIIAVALIGTGAAIFYIKQAYKTEIVDIPIFDHATINSLPSDSAPNVKPRGGSNTQNLTPKTLLLKVPFTPQAPTANWDLLHNEACEEAGAIMAAAYFGILNPLLSKEGWISPAGERQGGNLPANIVEDEIQKLTAWQDNNFGYHLDTTSAETAEMIEKVYGLKTKLINNFSADELKRELLQNHLVLISANGRKLKNPFYKRPGPIHHMLVIKGFVNGQFVTNDPGTKRGLNYIYSFNAIYNAAADWNHEQKNVDNNRKVAIVVWL